MKISVKIYGSLRQYFDQDDEIVCRASTTVGDLLHCLGVPETEVWLVVVNDKRATTRAEVRHGDSVRVFPMVGGGQ